MKKITRVLAVIIFVFCGSNAFATAFVPGEVLVKYRSGSVPGSLSGELGKIGWAKIRVNSGRTILQEMATLKRNSDILLVVPNTYGQFLSEPSDPYFDEQWYLTNVSAPEAWDISLGAGVTVAVIDSGVDRDHEDLADAILPDGWDFGDDDADPSDALGHGTQVAGVIAAIQNNNRGISGIAPACKLLPLKISLGGTGAFTEDAVAEAIIYAADHGAQIINLSLGWIDGEIHQVIVDAIDFALNKGVLLVAGAGNERGPVWFPAIYDEVLAVASSDKIDGKVYQ